VNRRRAALEAICQEYGIAILYSFGSRAREALAWLDDPAATLAPGPSDVDIGVKPLPAVKLNWREEVAIVQALEEFLGAQRVDLVNLDSANPYLAAEVVHGERLYAENEYAADNYDLYILRQEADLAPLEEETARLLLGITA
jgi:predicted nucleotidyltransferase